MLFYLKNHNIFCNLDLKTNGKCDFNGWKCTASEECIKYSEQCNGTCYGTLKTCGSKCIVPLIKTASSYEYVCNDQCINNTVTCNGNCPEGQVPCGKRCITSRLTKYYRDCDGKCISTWKACNGQCPEGRIACNGWCYPASRYWKCPDTGRCISKYLRSSFRS